MDAFTRRLGEGQGRIVRADGTIAFVLGDDQPGSRAPLEPGDHVEVVQDVDLTGIDLVRVTGWLRAPAGLPIGLGWRVDLMVDGTPRAGLTARPGATKDLRDLAANVSKVQGVRAVGIRLSLQRV